MTIRGYTNLWFFLSLIMMYESFALNKMPDFSILGILKLNHVFTPEFDLSPRPGKTISLWLGWFGIGAMLLTNFYVLKKRTPLFKKAKASDWLNFHIFCGLIGPTCILFHTNFKIGGLVAISFWSMTVSFASGVVGRYFYMQLVSEKTDLERLLQTWEQQIQLFSGNLSREKTEEARGEVLVLAGAGASGGTGVLTQTAADHISVAESVFNSMWGDLKLRFKLRGIAGKLPLNLQKAFIGFAKTKRRILYLEQFRKVMGYWHTFHMPFAVFMYIVAAIHITVALLFQV